MASCSFTQILTAATRKFGAAALRDALASHPTPPPIHWQRDPVYKDQPYSNDSTATFHNAGCYVCAYSSLLAALSYDVTPPSLAQELNDLHAFDGPELARPEALLQTYPKLGTYQRYDWITRRADLDIIRHALTHGPLIVQLDFLSKKGIQAHFATAYAYHPDPQDGQNDRLLVMCPWDGKYIDAAADVICNPAGKRIRGGYFWPAWWNESWMTNGDMTRVERVLHGARIFSLTEEQT